MPWIHIAPGADPYSIINSLSINPKAMAALQQLNRAVSFGSSALTRVEEEAIATAVSVANRCHY
ncbi:MAG: carboxymuconolactone decarboxylase family protein [Chloroflexi bacterium]|nr:carboxymuconolactone decarboxylase family protein [Chloroflexota bacterium]